MDRTKVGVLKQPDEVVLGCLLQRQERRLGEASLLAPVAIVRQFAHKALERQLPEEQLSGLLVLADFAKRLRSGAETVRLLVIPDDARVVVQNTFADRRVSPAEEFLAGDGDGQLGSHHGKREKEKEKEDEEVGGQWKEEGSGRRRAWKEGKGEGISHA